MTDPFRDGMQAVLERSEHLADENEELRDEIARLRLASDELRSNAGAVRGGESTPEARALADKAIDVLDQLEVVSRHGSKLKTPADRKFTGEERALSATSARNAERASGTSAADPREGAVDVTAPWREAERERNELRARWFVALIVGSVFFILGMTVDRFFLPR